MELAGLPFRLQVLGVRYPSQCGFTTADPTKPNLIWGSRSSLHTKVEERLQLTHLSFFFQLSVLPLIVCLYGGYQRSHEPASSAKKQSNLANRDVFITLTEYCD